jgi:membrane AbrB-like protein
MRLVAVMQYLRVVCVPAVASVVARVATSGVGAPAMPHWFAPVPAVPFSETMLLAVAGAVLGQLSRLPAGALLLPMVAGMALKGAGLLSITLPPPLLGAAYAVVGWSVGARFTGEVLQHAARALPRVLGAIAALIALCGLFAVLLHRMAGVDPLTAYLATSPGGADSVAIIASSVKVDVPFVLAMQVSRFMLVLLIGPTVARLVARAVSGADATAAGPAEGAEVRPRP